MSRLSHGFDFGRLDGMGSHETGLGRLGLHHSGRGYRLREGAALVAVTAVAKQRRTHRQPSDRPLNVAIARVFVNFHASRARRSGLALGDTLIAVNAGHLRAADLIGSVHGGLHIESNTGRRKSNDPTKFVLCIRL